jgi:hypothetical protein
VTDRRKSRVGTRGRPFPKGNAGRPRGSKNKVTLLAEQLFEDEAEGLTRKAIELALGGDGGALRLCLDRAVPLRRGRPVRFALPPLETASDLPKALGAVLHAVAAGELTPDEGVSLAQIVEARRRAIETMEIEARVTALEQAQGQ